MNNAQKLLKYLLFPGLALVTAGIVVGLLNNWTITAIALLVIGALLMVMSIAAGDFDVFKFAFWQRRSTQAGTNAVVSVLSVLVILGLINFVAARYDIRADITENQLLTLAPASQSVVENLEGPTTVTVLSQIPDPRDQRLLENYARYSGNFTYEFVNPFENPQLAQQLGAQIGDEAFVRGPSPAADGTDGGMRTLLVQRVNEQERLSESQLTNTLALLNQADISVVYFLQGHGEYAIDGSQAGMFEAASELQAENYTVEALNLAQTGAIPQDADVLIIAGPQQTFFDAEIIAIREYLAAGGSVFVLIDPQVQTGLEVLMSQWGVVPEDTIVLDTSEGGRLVGLGAPAPLVTDYGDHPITAEFDQGRSFYPLVRPLQVRDVPNTEVSPLLFTNQQSHAQRFEEGEDIEVDPERVAEGPFTLGVALARPAEAAAPTAENSAEDTGSADEPDAAESDETESGGAEETDVNENSSEVDAEEESRMVIIGNSTFATDGLFNQLLNGDVFLNSVGWLSNSDNPTLSIRPKEISNRRINLSGQQQIILWLLALLLVPLVGLIGAGLLWAQRR